MWRASGPGQLGGGQGLVQTNLSINNGSAGAMEEGSESSSRRKSGRVRVRRWGIAPVDPWCWVARWTGHRQRGVVAMDGLS